jgi:hypothetical protein
MGYPALAGLFEDVKEDGSGVILVKEGSRW